MQPKTRSEAGVTSILVVDGLSVSYDRIEALRSVSFTVGVGQIAAVIGPNGAGKSTLLHAIMGTLPPEGAARGTIVYAGESLARRPIEERVAAGLCLVPETRELFTTMTVEDNLLIGGFSRRRARDGTLREDRERVYAMFPTLRDRHRQLAGTLSGGERQMLALGRALMARPRLIMLDEPSLGLAPRIVRDSFRMIAGLRDAGTSLLLVEQNARAALELADTGFVVENGEIILHDRASDLARNPRVIESYLGLAAPRSGEPRTPPARARPE
jgi:branched-chain amino acid transport system ATP-binding protein